MDLLEYQGKQLLAAHGVAVPRGGVADTPDEAAARGDELGYPVVVKAQVQVGGRGKAGGIKVAANAEEARSVAGSMLHRDLKGHVVRRVWVEEASAPAQEYYASITFDRAAKLHLAMLSARGGIDIE